MECKKILSLVVAVALVLSCFPAGIAADVQATEASGVQTPTVVYTCGSVQAEGSIHVETFTDATAALRAKNRQWKSTDVVEIQFVGEISGGAQNGVLFRLETIWREDGTKLPIIIRGAGSIPDEAFIYLDAAGGWYACANDYTFINVTLPVGSNRNQTDFYAGSGNVRFENVNFKQKGVRIPNKDAQDAMHSISMYLGDYISTDPDDLIIPEMNLLPIAAAWNLARERNWEIGEGMFGVAGNYYGDYLHDGDTGGGQYLNGCIYFEVLTGISCIGNTWRPTAYHLDEDKVTFLQNVAHDTVLSIYGEDHFKTPITDVVGNDGWMNVLIMGSSNNAYLRDETCAIAKTAGVNMRIVHAYYSGVAIATQWSFIENNSKEYLVYYNENFGTLPNADKQAYTDFATQYPWDAIVTYQCSSKFHNDAIAYLNDSDATLATALERIEKADDLINHVYENSGSDGTRYYWFMPAAQAIGSGNTENAEYGRIFADTPTSAVFAGWPELAEGERVSTSITFGSNVDYQSTGNQIAAVSYLQEPPATAFNATTAAELTYPAQAGYENVADIRPIDVDASIIIDGEYLGLGRVCGKIGYAPSNATVIARNGTFSRIYGVLPPANVTAPFYGDLSVQLFGGSTSSNPNVVAANIIGDVELIIDGFTTNGVHIATLSAGCTVTGDLLVDVRDCTINNRLYVGSINPGSVVTGTATFRWGGGYINDLRIGVGATFGKQVNEFYANPDATVAASTSRNFVLAGYDANSTVTGEICNNFIGQIPSGIMNRIDWNGVNGNYSKIINTVKADSQGNAPTFNAYYGGVSSGTVTEIVNNIEAGTFKSFYGGSKVASETTKITNNISGGNFVGATNFGGAAAADTATVITAITGGTFPFDPTDYVHFGGCTTVIDNTDGTYTVSDHNYVAVEGTLPTCTQPSTVQYVCINCNATKTVDMLVDPKAHDWDKTNPAAYFCKNGCGATTDASHPFEYLQKVYCEDCKEYISVDAWSPISLDANGRHMLAPGHYYLTSDVTSASTADAVICLNTSGDNACIHLNGYDITATATRVFFGNGGLNIMGEGVVTGVSTGTLVGGAVHLNGYSAGRATGDIKIYGGTYRASVDGAAAISIGTTGGSVGIYGPAVVYGPLVVRGTENDATEIAKLTITDGTIKGALRGYTMHNQVITISGGEFEHNQFFTYYANQDTGTRKLSVSGGTFCFDPTTYISDDYIAELNDDNTYTVQKKIQTGLIVISRPDKTEYAVGEALNAEGLMLMLRGEDGSEEWITEGFALTGFSSAAVGKSVVTVSYEGYTTQFGVAVVDATTAAVDAEGNVYTSFAEALGSVKHDGKLTLMKSVEADVTISKDLCMDLNGQSINGTVTVKDGCTLYGADAKTDDYTIRDADGYGKLKVVLEGTGKVEGLPEASNLAKDGYLMVTEGEYVSFHRVNLQLTAMTLRATETGVYFKSEFAGDELVAEQVKQFGVALSIFGEPNAENLDTQCQYSWFDGFAAGKNNNDATSTLLQGIMKQSNTKITNRRNAELPVYGRAYVLLENGNYMFGASAQRSFREQIELVDASWEKLSAEQKTSVLQMYQDFETIMKTWDVPTIIREAANV